MFKINISKIEKKYITYEGAKPSIYYFFYWNGRDYLEVERVILWGS